MADDWISEVMEDLRAARGFLDRIAARLESHRAAGEATRCRDAAAVVIPHEGRVS